MFTMKDREQTMLRDNSLVSLSPFASFRQRHCAFALGYLRNAYIANSLER